MSLLLGKVAIVTGASKGIGASIARHFGANGASVVLNYSTDMSGAESAAQDILRAGGKAVCVQGDVSSQADIRKIVATAVAEFGKVDILVNNAGTWTFSPIAETEIENVQRMYNVNVIGTLMMIKEVSPLLSSGASIINIGSIESDRPTPNMIVYASTKGAIDTITRGLSRELGPRGIRVNTLAPGVTFTEGLSDVGYVEGSPIAQHVIDITPLGRGAIPEDMAKVATFLASDQSAFVSGERLLVAGGA